MRQIFDSSKADVQGTAVAPLAPERFDLSAYEDYALGLDQRVAAFAAAPSGVLVYRRFRVPEVFSHGCRDPRGSLELQLAALSMSMDYPSDIANFLEPWYGIGAVAGAFGADYVWNRGQAPAIRHPFSSIQEALNSGHRPIGEGGIGKATLEMAEYFLDVTKGRVPISLSDVQSPLNAAGEIVGVGNLFLEMADDPDGYGDFLALLTDKMLAFYDIQKRMIGDSLARPGHGFASSRRLSGIGLSDDNSVMISPGFFREYETEHRRRMGEAFGGVAFHSCGNWERLTPAVLAIPNLVCADGAFTPATDPDPNRPEPFAAAFSGAAATLHARAVGDPQAVADCVARLWKPPMKLIVCTYCDTPRRQEEAYRLIHDICR